MRIAFSTALVGFLALAASAEDVVLRPHYSQGDSYALSLTARNDARIASRGPVAKGFDEDAEIRYRATVVVLAVDADGVPLRERHQGVDLTIVRPGEAGVPFLSGTFEVRRDGGATRVFMGGERADRSVEQVVTRLLANQLEYGIGALLDPGRDVSVGERWELPEARVRAYLKAQGIRNAKLEEAAGATLVRAKDDTLAVRYRIPIESFTLRKLPENARTARSQGSLEGEVTLGTQRRPVRHAGSLLLEMNGAVVKSGAGMSAAYPWSYRVAKSLEQRTRKVEPEIASAY
jgi:hypothetical protein